MSNYQTPGVYVEEISTLPASVVAVETAIPAFIGYTELQPAGNGNRPVKISSLKEYVEVFGTAQEQNFILAVHDDYATASGPLVSRTLSVTLGATTKMPLYYQMQMYFDNGGGPCYIASVGKISTGPAADASDLTSAFAELEKEDEPTLIVCPDAAYLDPTEHGVYADAALAHCEKMGDRFAILDVPSTTVSGVDTNFRDETSMINLKYGAAYFPSLETNIGYYIKEDQITIAHTATDLDTGDPLTADAKTYMNTKKLSDLAGTFTTATVDYQETGVYNEFKSRIAEYRPTLFPCGSIAGVYCTVDRTRGVWKAPANIGLKSVIGPSIAITHDQQAGLNVDATSGKSINAIRAFTGRGTLVYGARTLMGNDNEWRYVPVRRLYIMAEESIGKATEFVVFEPNDANTWQRVRAMVENFLAQLWRQGALAGATPKEAFFVNCGLGTSMTQQDILEGRLIVEIGMAAVRPAEFIILRFSHKLQES